MEAKNARGDWSAWLTRHDVNMVVIEADWYAELANRLRHDPAWETLIDQEKNGRHRPGNLLFVAVRKHPL